MFTEMRKCARDVTALKWEIDLSPKIPWYPMLLIIRVVQEHFQWSVWKPNQARLSTQSEAYGLVPSVRREEEALSDLYILWIHGAGQGLHDSWEMKAEVFEHGIGHSSEQPALTAFPDGTLPASEDQQSLYSRDPWPFLSQFLDQELFSFAQKVLTTLVSGKAGVFGPCMATRMRQYDVQKKWREVRATKSHISDET